MPKLEPYLAAAFQLYYQSITFNKPKFWFLYVNPELTLVHWTT